VGFIGIFLFSLYDFGFFSQSCGKTTGSMSPLKARLDIYRTRYYDLGF